jgi:hypothetical protein
LCPTLVSKDIKQGVCHPYGLAIHIIKYLKAKEEELWKLKIFHHANIKSSKKVLKSSKNPSRDYNSVTTLKFQYKPKYHRSKILV